jgi:hypothetical protein
MATEVQYRSSTRAKAASSTLGLGFDSQSHLPLPPRAGGSRPLSWLGLHLLMDGILIAAQKEGLGATPLPAWRQKSPPTPHIHLSHQRGI